MSNYHIPVLKDEVLEYLRVKPGDKVIDCTLGNAGHTISFLERGAKVLGLDFSPEAMRIAKERIKNEVPDHFERFTGVVGNFRDVESIAKRNDFENVSGIVFDLGFNSLQLEGSGISFLENAPLDMRLDPTLGVTAADLVNTLSASQLQELFSTYGEERLAKRFAQTIVEGRKLKKLRTTKDLTNLIVSAAPSGYERGRLHPATRVYQALRIVVNDELENLRVSLPQAARLLKLPGGRMVVISFHSLEDKVAKQFGQNARPKLKTLTKRPIVPSESEIEKNVRARSAKMRIYERI